jgi:hypothetical protein
MAVAGDIGNTSPTTFASEANPGVNAVTGPSLIYQWGVPVNPGVTVTLKISLDNGATWVAGVTPATAVTCSTATPGINTTSTAVVVSPDGSTLNFSIDSGAGFLAVANSCTFTPSPAQMKAPSLSTPGGVVNATWRNFVGQSEIDIAGKHTDIAANSAAAINGKIAASSTFPPPTGTVTETAVIDLTGNNSKVFVVPLGGTSNTIVGVPPAIGTVLNLGAVTFTDVPGSQVSAAGLDYTLAANTSGFTGKVTGDFQATAGAHLDLKAASNCTGAATPAGTPSAPAGSSFDFTSAAPFVTGAPLFFCYTVDGIAQIPSTTPVASFKTTPTLATDLPDSATGNLFALGTNGATVDIVSYVPAGNIPDGFLTFIRVVNTGNRPTPIQATIVNADGSTGPSGVIINVLPVGGAVTLTSREIELAIGVVGRTDRPRLRLFGSTSSLTAQSFMSNPGGVVTNNSAVERGGSSQ